MTGKRMGDCTSITGKSMGNMGMGNNQFSYKGQK